MLALVDCNSFYASCEQIYRPDLRGKPIVVLSNNDGCIVTRNKEAKQLQIPDLQPYFKIKHLLEQHSVITYSSNYALYGDTSARIMMLLERYGIEIEVYSIDEAFLLLPAMQKQQYIDHGLSIKSACWKEQRIPVCVGIASTKTLAKLANHIAKKSNRLQGVCYIDNIDNWQGVFKKLAVNKVWGIGSRLHQRLQSMGIHSVQDFIDQSPKRIRKAFGVVLERTHAELNGEPCLALETQPSPKKEIVCSRSFGTKVASKQYLRESIANYTVRAAEKLRRQQSLTGRLSISIQSSRFKQPYYGNSASTALPYPTNDTKTLLTLATKLLDTIYKPGYDYARAGVALLDLVTHEFTQGDLFTPGQSEKSKDIMRVIDALNNKHGKGNVFFAAQGIERKWAMVRNMKSPAYTTRIDDIPTVKL